MQTNLITHLYTGINDRNKHHCGQDQKTGQVKTQHKRRAETRKGDLNKQKNDTISKSYSFALGSVMLAQSMTHQGAFCLGWREGVGDASNTDRHPVPF